MDIPRPHAQQCRFTDAQGLGRSTAIHIFSESPGVAYTWASSPPTLVHCSVLDIRLFRTIQYLNYESPRQPWSTPGLLTRATRSLMVKF